MVAEFLDCLVFVAVVDDGAVVAGKNDEGILRELQFFERAENLADLPVGFENRIAARPHRGLSYEARIRHARHVDAVQCVVEEERFVLCFVDELHGFAREIDGHILVLPKRLAAAFHEADAPHAIVHGHVVSVAPVHFQLAAICDARGQTGKRCFVGDFDRVRRIEPDNEAVCDIDAGHPVSRRSHDECAVEAGLVRAGCDRFVPVLFLVIAEAEVPLADSARSIADGAQS